MTAQRKFVEGIGNSPRSISQYNKTADLINSPKLLEERNLLQGKLHRPPPPPLKAQGIPAPSRTGVADSPGTGVQSLSRPSPDRVRIRRNPAKPAELSTHAPIQAQFVDISSSHPTVAELKSVIERLRVAGFTPENGMPLETLVKKLAEGPDIFFTDDRSLITRIEERLSGRAGSAFVLPKASGGSAFRKIHRLFRQIVPLPSVLRTILPSKLPSSGNPMLQAVDSLTPDIGFLLHEPDPTFRSYKAREILRDCDIILTNFSDLLASYPVEKNFQRFWECFNLLSGFGPLSRAVIIDAKPTPTTADNPDLVRFEAFILENLRDIRQLLSRRPTLAVIAHRGTGPTNRNMGGLIPQQDARRLSRRAENSPEAFYHALTIANSKPFDLDGIECDVFLSQDGVPIVTHEGNWFEQLSTARQKLQGSLSHNVHDLTANHLISIQRTGSRHSRFMTLAELLDMARGVAVNYFGFVGRPFRIEIEMKGTKEETGGVGTRRPGALRDATAKVISRAVKANCGVPVEYVLFNGTAADLPGFALLRSTKTALGGLFTGYGGAATLPLTLTPLHVDELRYGFNVDPSGSGPTLPLTERNLRDFIVTLVFAQEFAPLEFSGSLVEPTHDIETKGHTAVSKDLARRSKSQPTSSDISRTALFDFLRRMPPDIRLHLLTDYPEVATWLKKSARK